MKASKISPETMLMVCTFPLWAPAMLAGIVVGIIVVGFMRGMRLITGE
jgi:hypothetical protein